MSFAANRSATWMASPPPRITMRISSSSPHVTASLICAAPSAATTTGISRSKTGIIAA